MAARASQLQKREWPWDLARMGMVAPPACVVLTGVSRTTPTVLTRLSGQGFSVYEGNSSELCRTHIFPANSVLCWENWPLAGWCRWLQAFPLSACCSHMDARTHAAFTAGGFAAADFFPFKVLIAWDNSQAQKQCGSDDPLLVGHKNLFACLSPTLVIP